MQIPLQSHQKAVKRRLRCLAGTLDSRLLIQSNFNSSITLLRFCDADCGLNPDNRISTSRFCVFLGSNLISLQAKRQHVVPRSSTEAKYRSLAHLVAKLTWISSVLSELKPPLSKHHTVSCDNLSTVLLSVNPIQHSKTKHVELDLYFFREVIQGKVIVEHLPSVVPIVDILIQAISSTRFHTMHSKLRVRSLTTLSLRGNVKDDDEDSHRVVHAATSQLGGQLCCVWERNYGMHASCYRVQVY